jgi:hypothetical protein
MLVIRVWGVQTTLWAACVVFKLNLSFHRRCMNRNIICELEIF